MGWFSRSTADQKAVSDEGESLAVPPAPTVTLTPASEAPKATPLSGTEETTPSPAQTTESNIQPQLHPQTQTGPQTIGMDFEEYRDSDDMFARFKVSDAMTELFACSSLGSNIRNYYRFGTYKNCEPRYNHLKFCLSLKTKSSQVAQVMIQRRDAELRAKKKSMPNSEDVWSLRTHPPEELVALAGDY